MPIAKIIIDFDDTLFDTASTKEDLLALFARFGVSAEKFWKTYKISYIQNDLASYNLWRHIDNACQQFLNLDKKSLLIEAEALFENDKYLLAGAENFLNELRDLGVPLILLSLGDANWQKQKVDSVGMVNFFNEVIFTGRKKTDVIQPLIKDAIGDIIFINDKIAETQEIAALSDQIKPILRMKNGVAASDYKQSGIPYFKNFSEILTRVKKYV
ncbi:MAG: HAD hydrolase-like protein [Candidatus Magasanikbacteria bacterium]|nr:HAD hydrolase-like protein [Candidatus Magasanikbacteria bacterium]